MFIKLTNANPLHRGETILLNSDMILSVYGGDAVREDGTIDRVTFVYVPPHGMWEVQETVDTVYSVVRGTDGAGGVVRTSKK